MKGNQKPQGFIETIGKAGGRTHWFFFAVLALILLIFGFTDWVFLVLGLFTALVAYAKYKNQS